MKARPMTTTWRVLLAGAGVLCLPITAPGTASAEVTGHPSGCVYQVADSWRTVARCDKSNGGHYRAVARCKDPGSGEVQEFVGNWRNDGGWSKAYCEASTRPLTAGVETKAN